MEGGILITHDNGLPSHGNNDPCPMCDGSTLSRKEQRAIRRSGRTPMPNRFYALSVYNAEKARGLVHTASYMLRMTEQQVEFDAWAKANVR